MFSDEEMSKLKMLSTIKNISLGYILVIVLMTKISLVFSAFIAFLLVLPVLIVLKCSKEPKESSNLQKENTKVE